MYRQIVVDLSVLAFIKNQITTLLTPVFRGTLNTFTQFYKCDVIRCYFEIMKILKYTLHVHSYKYLHRYIFNFTDLLQYYVHTLANKDKNKSHFHLLIWFIRRCYKIDKHKYLYSTNAVTLCFNINYIHTMYILL